MMALSTTTQPLRYAGSAARTAAEEDVSAGEIPPFGELGLEERAHFGHEGGEGGLVCLQDVVGAVECDKSTAGHQCVKILGFGEGERLVSATVENQGR